MKKLELIADTMLYKAVSVYKKMKAFFDLSPKKVLNQFKKEENTIEKIYYRNISQPNIYVSRMLALQCKMNKEGMILLNIPSYVKNNFQQEDMLMVENAADKKLFYCTEMKIDLFLN